MLGGSGHIAGIVNPPAANKYGFWINPAAKLPATPDDWLAGAQQNAGSWWTDWQAWLTAMDSEQTEPLIEVYRERRLLVEIDGMGEVDEVTKRIFDALDVLPQS